MLQAEVSEWVSSKHNMGMALTRAQWANILSCTNKFCKVGTHSRDRVDVWQYWQY